MTRSIELDQLLDDWLGEGPTQLPDRVIASIAADIQDAAPTRRWRLPWREPMNRNLAWAGTAVIGVIAAGLMFGLLANGPGFAGPSPTAAPSASASSTPSPLVQASSPPGWGGRWPQSTLEEWRAAQARADAGDPDYTWQLDPALSGLSVDDWHRGEDWANHVRDEGIQVAERFLRDELGWEAFLFNVVDGMDDDGGADGIVHGLVYIRCASGKTNALYPIAQDGAAIGADRCAPTIDDLRYETVSIDLWQPVQRGPRGIWVVSRWRMTSPFTQADARVIQATAEARLQEFLQARLDGEGAEGYVTVFGQTVVPLAYATSAGAPYERFEIERVGGPYWPSGDLEFEVRLFADNGSTVVEQKIEAYENGTLALDRMLTTENGRLVPQPFVLMDGKLSLFAPHPWNVGFLSDHGHTALDYDDKYEERIEFVDDPLTVGTGCDPGQSAANAAALADAVRSDPDLVATAPVTVTIAGHQGLSMDVTAAPGASICDEAVAPQVLTHDEDGPDFHGVTLFDGGRMRLYLLDAPEGSPIGILAIAITAPGSRFEGVIEATTPILETLEFLAP